MFPGLDNQKTRKSPELLDSFEDDCFGVQQICLDKYHTVFLTHTGQAYSCGLGQGGKLGHDSEFTSISPKKICLDLESVSSSKIEPEVLRTVSVAAGLHHTLFLANNGRVVMTSFSGELKAKNLFSLTIGLVMWDESVWPGNSRKCINKTSGLITIS